MRKYAVRCEGPKSLFESGAFNRALPPLRFVFSYLQAVTFALKCWRLFWRRSLADEPSTADAVCEGARWVYRITICAVRSQSVRFGSLHP